MRRILTLGFVFVLSLALAAPVLAEGSIVHTVQPGENLFRIGLRYGVTVKTLAAANGLRNPSHIYVGQRLVIPIIFIVVVAVKPLRDFFELVLLRPVDYLVLGLCA